MTRASETADRRLPSFAEEVDATLAVHAPFVPHGDVRDDHLVVHRGRDRTTDMAGLLWHLLRHRGYDALLRYDAVDGFTVHPGAPRLGPGRPPLPWPTGSHRAPRTRANCWPPTGPGR